MHIISWGRGHVHSNRTCTCKFFGVGLGANNMNMYMVRSAAIYIHITLWGQCVEPICGLHARLEFSSDACTLLFGFRNSPARHGMTLAHSVDHLPQSMLKRSWGLRYIYIYVCPTTSTWSPRAMHVCAPTWPWHHIARLEETYACMYKQNISI